MQEKLYAFPTGEDEFSGAELRDYFAAHVLPVAIALNPVEDIDVSKSQRLKRTWLRLVALDAYDIADAMLEARGR